MTRVQGCCCFSLQTGSLIIATLGWIGTVMKLFGLAGSAGYKQEQDQYNQDEHQAATLGYRIGYAVVTLICCILLVVGIYKKSPNYFIPWMIVSCIEAVLITVLTGMCLVFIFVAPSAAFGVLFAICLVSSALAWYFWIVVYSHYQEVKLGVVNVVTGTGGNIYYSPTSTNPPAYEKEHTQMA